MRTLSTEPAQTPSATFFPAAHRGLRGTLRVPGDKSISHRAALLGAVNSGPLRVSGFLRADDTLASLRAVEALGVETEWRADDLIIHGRGWEGLKEPEDIIDVGNAGTLIRLLPGLVASIPFLCILTGDASIRRRPMARILEPLAAMGACVSGRRDDTLPPFALRGGPLRGMVHHLPVASAQVKSCLILAGLRARGETTIVEPAPSRDHTERMVRHGGGSVERETLAHGAGRLTVQPLQSLRLPNLTVPGDFSSAAFFLVAALLVPDSLLTVAHVGLNPSRTGLLEILGRMGAEMEVRLTDLAGPEPMGDISVRTTPLRATEVRAEEIPNVIDELPLFLLAAARAEGVSRLRGAGELRSKESDRLGVMAAFLRTLGVPVQEYPDGIEVEGRGQWDRGFMYAQHDHRMAMTAAVAGLASTQGVTVDDTTCVSVSFPGFAELLESVGGTPGQNLPSGEEDGR